MNIKNLVNSVENINKDELVQYAHNLLCDYDFSKNNIVIPVYVELNGYYNDLEVQCYFNNEKQLYGFILDYGNLYVDLNSLSVYTLLQLCNQLSK